MKIDYTIPEITPYINWAYFFHAWGTAGMTAADKQRLKAEAEERLERYATSYRTHALFRLFDAYSRGDDIVVVRPVKDSGIASQVTIPCLRQQQEGSELLCLADFIGSDTYLRTSHGSPRASVNNTIGLFATSVDAAMERDFCDDPYEKMMMQVLADRLAEATAECLHQQVRTRFWGYAPNEQLTIADLLSERWQGIRPAVGYPSLPDTSINFLIDHLLNFHQIGIRLTASGAMRPHASVSGLMMAHPDARYFSVGTIGDDQLSDYARRRGLPLVIVRKYLAGNL